MSGNPQLDAQIIRAVQPQFDPMQAIQQMQRPAVQMPVQNPVFGGTIPMNFGLPQASQMPAGYVPRLAAFRPSQAPISDYAPVEPVNPFGSLFAMTQAPRTADDGTNSFSGTGDA